MDSVGLKDFAGLVEEDVSGDLATPAFLSCLSILVSELSKLNAAIKYSGPFSSVDQAFGDLKDDPPPFLLPASNVKYKLLVHLCSQIQSERLILHNERSSAMVIDESESTSKDASIIVFMLQKICKLLSVRPCIVDNQGLIEAIEHRLLTVKNMRPALFQTELPLLLPNLPKVESKKQQEKLEVMEELLYQDFKVRRELLLKRVELTVESFLWSERAEAEAARIRAAVLAQKQQLSHPPMRYQLEHVRQANVALLQEQSKRVTADTSQYVLTQDSSDASGEMTMKSIVKQVLVGNVPDRGGRANEVRSKHIKEDMRRSFGNNSGKRSNPASNDTIEQPSAGTTSKTANTKTAEANKANVKSADTEQGNKQGNKKKRGGGNGGNGGKGGDGEGGKKSVSDGGILARASSAGRERPVSGGSNNHNQSTGNNKRATTVSKELSFPAGTKVTTIVGTHSNVGAPEGSGRTVSVTVREAAHTEHQPKASKQNDNNVGVRVVPVSDAGGHTSASADAAASRDQKSRKPQHRNRNKGNVESV